MLDLHSENPTQMSSETFPCYDFNIGLKTENYLSRGLTNVSKEKEM